MLGRLRQKYEAGMHPIGRRLGRLGAKPSAITSVSLMISCLSAVAYASRSPVIGAFGLAMSGFVDMLDGAVARATGATTRFGAVYDHTADRYAEFVVLLGIALGGLVDWVWVVFTLFGMVMASYVRAKAESIGGLRSCTVGIAERQEKIILLLIGSLLQPFAPLALPGIVIIVGLLSHVTVIQRLDFTFKNA